MENKMYLVVNGDNVGEQLSDIIVNDDVQGFEQTSSKFNQARQAIDEMVQQAGGRVVVSNADEAVYELPESDYSELADQIMQSYKEAAGTSVTIGSGSTLSQAYKALNDGKEAGKDQYMPYSDENQSEDVDFQQDTNEEQAPEIEEDEQLVPDNSTQDEMEEDTDGIDQETNTDQNEEFGEDFQDDQTQDTDNPDFDQDQYMEEDTDGIENDEDVISDDYESDFSDIDEDGEHEDIHSLLASHMSEDDEDMEDDQSDDVPFLQDHEIQYDEESPEMQDDQGIEDQIQNDQIAQEPNQEEPQTDEELKQRIMMSLQQFKENKGAIEQAKQTDPEAYQSMISMLQAMIAMAKQLGVSVEDQPEVEQDRSQDVVEAAPQGQPVPKM